jgi:hypothetical protein
MIVWDPWEIDRKECFVMKFYLRDEQIRTFFNSNKIQNTFDRNEAIFASPCFFRGPVIFRSSSRSYTETSIWIYAWFACMHLQLILVLVSSR